MSSDSSEGHHPGMEPRRVARVVRNLSHSSSSSSSQQQQQQPKRRHECGLCRSDFEIDPVAGLDLQLIECPSSKLQAHYFCLLFSSGLHQRGREDQGLKGFLPDDVRREMKRGNRLKCVYCKEKGATVGCAKQQCKKSYHLPCGMKNHSLQQFFDQFKSFCNQHRPTQKVARQKAKSSDGSKTECAICFKKLGPKIVYECLSLTCCEGGWVHRHCLQDLAVKVGSHDLTCPLCKDLNEFNREMLQYGIHIPQHDTFPAHDNDDEQNEQQESEGDNEIARDANDSLSTSQSRRKRKRRKNKSMNLTCSAKVCIAEHGDKTEHDADLWTILACFQCSNEGIHVKCGGLEQYVDPEWYCYVCRRVADIEVERRRAVKPLRTRWGLASGTVNGYNKSISKEREEIFEFFRNFEQYLIDDSVPFDYSLKAQEEDHDHKPHKRELHPSDPMNVTLEDLIIKGLNRGIQQQHESELAAPSDKRVQQAHALRPPPNPSSSTNNSPSSHGQSPGDSDYESAHESPYLGMGVPLRKKLKIESKSSEMVAIPTISQEEAVTLDQKIKNTIKDYFHNDNLDR